MKINKKLKLYFKSITLRNLLFELDIAESIGQSYRFIKQGAVFVNEQNITEAYKTYRIEDFSDEFIIRIGNTNIYSVVLKKE